MEKIKLVETFDDTPTVSLTEEVNKNKASRVDNKYIIGMIEGQFFKPDGMSRNGRWYPRSLWTKALAKSDTKNRLANSTMFGEIGHSDGPVEDMTLRNGGASHFIDDLWIDEKGRGMGRAYILGTPAGQLLKIYLGAGCKLKVSTRGEGCYKEGEFHNNCPVIDDETYDFQTVDFVLNPGFLETSAVLKESYNKLNREYTKKELQQIKETIAHVKKEGEKRMELNIDAYVTDLKEELKIERSEVKSLNEQLNAKSNELLQSKLDASAEIKRLTEELKPYKDLKVSAKAISENFKKLQNDLKKANAEKSTLTEELNTFKSLCGSAEEVKSAVRLSTKSLKMIEEYRKIGTPKQFQEAMEALKTSEETKDALVKSTNYIKSLKEKLNVARVEKRDLFEAKKAIARSKEAIKSLTETASKSEKLVEKYKSLKEDNDIKTRRLEETVEKTAKLIKKYEALKAELAESKKAIVEATKLIKSLKSKQMSESVVVEKPETIKNEAIEMSEKFGCTVETAAKVINKKGLTEAKRLMESASKVTTKKSNGLLDSQKLVEEVAQLDKVTEIPVEKTAKDFLKSGMIMNYFNHDSLGKEVIYQDMNKLDGTKVAGENQAKELLKKFGKKVEVAKAPEGLKKELTPAQAEAEAQKLLK